MYELNLAATSRQTSIATNMVSMSSTNAFIADQRIATLEQEIFNLRNAKRTFDGVEILKPTHANKPNSTEQPKVPEWMTKPVPFANVTETSYQPSHKCNFTAAVRQTSQG
jgi:hypothetical protein